MIEYMMYWRISCCEKAWRVVQRIKRVFKSLIRVKSDSILAITTGIISVDKVEELLIFLKQQLSPRFNICSLTFVNY